MSEMLLESLSLVVLGMGVVFAFLAALIALVSINARLVARFAPAPAATVASRAGVAASAEDDELAEVAAMVALLHHRRLNEPN